MAQSIREVIGHARKVIRGLPLLGTLLITGMLPSAGAATTHAFRTSTMRPSLVAFSPMKNGTIMHHQHEMGTIPVTFRFPRDAQTGSGGGPSAGKEAMNQHGKEEMDQNEIEFHGITTSRVGADNMLHFRVGSLLWSIPLTANTDLHKVGGSAQTIEPNQRVEVEVLVTGTQMTVTQVKPED